MNPVNITKSQGGEPATKPMDYGFSSNYNDLSTIRPRKTNPKKAKSKRVGQGAQTNPVIAPKKPILAADRTANAHGFLSREGKPIVLKKRRRTHHDEPVDQLSIRGPVRILNDFIIYCEDQSLSYWEGLEALLQSNRLSKK